ncbi:MAG: hypothetical protein WA821_02035 [Anaerolineales bacterium]
MAAIVCPTCNKPNPDALDVCQFCGTPLKNRGTEPLPTIRPGEMPIKQQTSDLENTLPAWLRDIRKGDEESTPPPLPGINAPVTPQPAKPETPKKKDGSPLDFLAELSQIKDEDETVPDWLASLGGNAPSKPAPAAEVQPQEPADWLAGLKADSAPQATASEPSAVDWAFKNDADKPGQQAFEEETPDWLTALKAQDTSVNAPAQPKPAESSPADAFPSSGNLPDWLNDLGGGPAAPVASAPSAPAVQTPSPVDDLPSDADLPGWLSDLAQDSATPVKPAAQPASAAPTPALGADLPAAGDFPDWLADLGKESMPSAQPSQPAPVKPATQPAPAAFTPAAASAPSTSSPTPVAPAQAGQVLPDWLADLGKESSSSAQPAQPAPVASQDLSSGDNLPEWLTGLTSEPPKTPAVEAPSVRPADETLPAWLESAVEAKPPEKPVAPPPSTAKKAFGTGALKELAALDQPDQVPDWMAGLVSTTPAKTPEPATPAAPGADAFDWLSGLNQAGTSPAVTEPKPTGQPQSAVEKQAAPEAPTPASSPDSGSAQSMDSIFSMEMPDWLSGFTPSEPEPAKATEEQPGTSTDNLSPADLPSWVQAMRPIESVMSGAQSDDEDQTVEKEGPLAGLRSVLPGQANIPGQRKPKAYSIKLQVDTTQMAQATLLENLIASEAESRPVSTIKQVFNIRPLRWMIALVLLVAVLAPAIVSTTDWHFFPLPASASASETKDFYDLVGKLPDAAAVLVVFDYQPGYAGEMEQVAGPVIDHLMTQNAHLAFVSTSPTGVLMNERIMAAQNHLRATADDSTYEQHVQYVDLGYLPGDAAGIQVFAENPRILGTDYQIGDLWTSETGFDQIHALSDFKAVIVLTDNPDTGRMWIEQTGQALKGKPLLMVVSAQAAPMIRPYYESSPKQVQGMVSGLVGGAAYEEATQRPGNAALYWDCYGAGMIAAEMLIVVGGVWALVQHMRMRRAEQNQEEDEA